MVAMIGETKMRSVARGDVPAEEGAAAATTAAPVKKKGGLFKAMKRMLAGESFFINEYKAGENGAILMLAPSMPGDIVAVEVAEGVSVIAQAGSFLAYELGVTMDTQFGGAKNLFSGESLFWLKFEGAGRALLSSFGAIYEVPVQGEYIVDSGHVVAFEEQLSYKVGRASKGLGNMLGSGEGLVMTFSGNGKLWVQSHHTAAFGKRLSSHLKPT